MKYIFETPVYCGSLKEWRVLNLNSGTVYSSRFDSWSEASNSIKDGEKRAGKIVKRIDVSEIATILDKQVL